MRLVAGSRRNGDGLGARLRVARESRGIGVRELARRIGVSASLISQIETGKSEPSVSTLMAIVSELDVSPNEVVFDTSEATRAIASAASDGASARSTADPASSARPDAAGDLPWQSGADDTSGWVLQHDARRAIQLETGVRWERLTPGPDHDVDFLLVTYEPGGASTPFESLMRHNGREYGYVLSGRLLVSIGFDGYELGPGDSIAFESTQPHRLATIGDEPAVAIWFVVGRRSP